jgi:tRNA A37 threonylcarbamoyladenosine dehydratase
MGAGGKMDASKVKVADINNTVNCFLAKAMKKKLRAVKIDKLKVVFSSEIQDESSLKTTDGSNYKKSFYGTNSYMPGLFGLHAAETVIRHLLQTDSK